jgi:hypothetical protein
MLSSVRFRYALLLLVSLILADGIITEYVTYYGLAWESNPILRGLLPTGHFMLVKIVGSLMVVLLLGSIYRQQPKIATTATWLFVLVYTGIVYWNISGLLLVSSLIG